MLRELSEHERGELEAVLLEEEQDMGDAEYFDKAEKDLWVYEDEDMEKADMPPYGKNI